MATTVRWTPPNKPSLGFQERVAFDNLSGFLSGDSLKRTPVFDSATEGQAHFGTAVIGDHFISTGAFDTVNVPGMWYYSVPTGWMVWDLDNWFFSPASTGLTIGNGQFTARCLRAGRIVHVKFHLLWGSTTSASGAWNAVWELPNSANSGLPYDLTAEFVTFGGSVPYTQDFNGQGDGEFLDNTPLRSYMGRGRLESTTTIRGVTVVANLGDGLNGFGPVTSTVPFTWATNDQLTMGLSYIWRQ